LATRPKLKEVSLRIISFCKRWTKLEQSEFTTFRFPRKDRDWEVGERVQVYLKNRSPQRENLGEAKIIKKEMRVIATIHTEYLPTEEEAIADGFNSLIEMNEFFRDTYGSRIFGEPINKLTLRWVK
jgi:hypothetical protein